MELEQEQVGTDTVVLRPDGRLNLAVAARFKEAVDAQVAGGRRIVVVDLARVSFLDSSGLGALVGGLRSARAAGGDLRIARAGEQVLTVLELTTMARVLHPHATVEDALAAG